MLFDSGIRTGSDVLKAIALGADAVCLGRPYVYGLALDGQAGVEHVLRCLLADLDLSLALSGHTNLAQVGRSSVTRLARLSRRPPAVVDTVAGWLLARRAPPSD